MFCFLAFLGLRCVRWCAASRGHGVAAFGRNQSTGTWTGVWYPRSINIRHRGSNFLSNLKKKSAPPLTVSFKSWFCEGFCQFLPFSYTTSPYKTGPFLGLESGSRKHPYHLRLGFVMCNVPEQLPGVVKLLAESHVLKNNIPILIAQKW